MQLHRSVLLLILYRRNLSQCRLERISVPWHPPLSRRRRPVKVAQLLVNRIAARYRLRRLLQNLPSVPGSSRRVPQNSPMEVWSAGISVVFNQLPQAYW